MMSNHVCKSSGPLGLGVTMLRFCFIAFIILAPSVEVVAQQAVVPNASPGVTVATPAAAGTDGKAAGKDGTKKDGDKKKTPSQPIVIKRGSEPEEGISASEVVLRHEPGDRVAFSFVGAKWLPVLKSVATASKMSLDWQELPGDYLNLVTERTYTIEEARDVINRHLLARGYTMLTTDSQDLEVVKLTNLNTARVPRVTPEGLDDRFDHEFAKVSFRLNWLIAEEAVAELGAMKSKYGKLVHLSATNRIEAIDTVKNLKDIRDLLSTEQSDEGQEKLLKNIPLKYRRASEVIDIVREFMNVDAKPKPGRSSGGSSSSMQMMQQMQRQMQQQMQRMNSSATKKGGSSRVPEEVSIVLNQRENSILVKAPPNKMAQIEQAIAALDVPSDSANSLLNNLNKYKSYQLESFGAQPLVDMLNELGDLSPRSQLRVDEDKNTIIAYASLADHLTISSLIEKLDEKRRHFEVLQLRRLESDFVAGTIRFLMGDDGEENDSNSSYGYWGGYGYGSDKKDDKSNEFRVDADVQNNRLLLFASEQELEQIEDLLVKLGEIPEKNSRESRRRLIDVDPNVDPEEFLKRIRSLWPKENELRIDPVPEEVKQQFRDQGKEETPDAPTVIEPAKPKPDPATPPAGEEPVPPNKSVITQTEDVEAFFVALAQQGSTAPKPPENPQKEAPTEELTPEQKALKEIFDKSRKQPTGRNRIGAADSLPPVNIGFTPTGRLMITSDSPGALDDMEEILMPFTQTRKKYVIFTLKYASPGWTAATLRDYFKDDDGTEPVLDWWGDIQRQKKSSGRLSSRPTPRFIADSYSSTILVRGADARQLKEIEELIELYDTPQPSDSRSVRVNAMFKIKYSKATVIANAIKDVYRDLLSANDKALQKPDKGSVDQSVTYIRGSGNDSDDEQTNLRFKGDLSVGVDEISNTIIISSTQGLLENIRQMITQLDQAAKPASSVKVLKIKSDLNPRYIQQRLSDILGPAKVKTSKTKTGQAQPNQAQPNGGQAPKN